MSSGSVIRVLQSMVSSLSFHSVRRIVIIVGCSVVSSHPWSEVGLRPVVNCSSICDEFNVFYFAVYSDLRANSVSI